MYLTPSVDKNQRTDTIKQSIYLSPYIELKNKTRTKALEWIYLIGGETQHGEPLDIFERYDPIKNSWSQLAPLPFVRSFMGLCDLGGYLYVIGGRDAPRRPVSSVFRYNRVLDEWQEMKSMLTRRSAPAVAVLNGYIYVMGGDRDIEDGGTTNSVERYDPVLNIWEQIPRMTFARHHFGADVLDGYLYVVGGSAVNGSFVEKYDPDSNNWSLVEAKSSGHELSVYYNSSVCSLDNKLYIMDDIGITTYAPSKNKWTNLETISNKIQNLGSCIAEGNLFIVNTDKHSTSFNKYDIRSMEWVNVQQIPTKRFYPGIITSSSIRESDYVSLDD